MKITEAIRYLTPIRNSASLKHYRDALTTAIDALEFRRKHEHPLTNADRIRAMTDEELAKIFEDKYTCPCSPLAGGCKWPGSCRACWLEWLRQPVKED